MTCNGIRFIIGLGNPGKQYSNTRHNVGASWVESLGQEAGLFVFQKHLDASYTQLNLPHTNIHLFIPTTFMNHSGYSVDRIMKFYKVPVSQMLIVHDELDLLPGDARLKQGGGSGGHNGLKDIISVIKTPDFWRLRIGVGHPGIKAKVASYVLSKPNLDEDQQIQTAMLEAKSVFPLLARGDMQTAMQTLHSRIK